MDLLDRMIMLFIGGVLGYMLARVVDYLKDKKHPERQRNDRGVSRLRPVILDFVLLCVVGMVVSSSFTVQHNANLVEDNQARLSRITVCNQKFLSKTITALNERTLYTVAQAKANVEVQTAQADFFLGIAEDPYNDELELRLFKAYTLALQKFIDVSGKTTDRSKEFPYATPEELRACLKK